MRYMTITAADATIFLSARRSGAEFLPVPQVRERGHGHVNEVFVVELREELCALRAKWSAGLKNDRERTIFEGRAAKLVHSIIPAEPEMLGDSEFWLWLATTHFSDLVEWRYGNPRNGTKLANYGIGSRSENLLFRLWMRAELTLDDTAEDRYHLAQVGQIDFYRSHLFRQSYANARNFARALLRFQYPGIDVTAPKLKVLEIRTLVKRLRRLRSNLFLEILAEEECRAVIEAEAAVVMVR
jgi:hypothetical protein